VTPHPRHDEFGICAPFSGSLNGKRQYFPGEWCRKLPTHRRYSSTGRS
jgi:hypothetical protein